MSTQNTTESSILRPLLGLGAAVLILAGMWAGKEIVNQLLMAGLLTLLCIPLLDWMKKKGMSTPVAMTLIILLVLFLAVFLVGLVGISAAHAQDAIKTATISERICFVLIYFSPFKPMVSSVQYIS